MGRQGRLSWAAPLPLPSGPLRSTHRAELRGRENGREGDLPQEPSRYREYRGRYADRTQRGFHGVLQFLVRVKRRAEEEERANAQMHTAHRTPHTTEKKSHA